MVAETEQTSCATAGWRSRACRVRFETFELKLNSPDHFDES